MDATIQWYPGHIAKLERELQQILKQLDVIIEVVDARIPRSTQHTILSEKVRQQKPVLVVLNKSDLADPYWTKQWVEAFKHDYPEVLSFDSSTGKGKAEIISAVVRLGEAKMLQQEAKGLKRRPIRIGVIGMPNVGKSTLINTLVGQKKVRTGHRAGVTRTTQWVRIHPQIELLDTPGLIPPRLDSQETAQMLASVYSIGDATFDEEAIILYFIEQMEAVYPGALRQALDLPGEGEVTLEAIAERRHYYQKGETLDMRRTAQAVLKDYRHGKLGRLTLERPTSEA